MFCGLLHLSHLSTLIYFITGQDNQIKISKMLTNTFWQRDQLHVSLKRTLKDLTHSQVIKPVNIRNFKRA
jgi:hypothetical protein